MHQNGTINKGKKKHSETDVQLEKNAGIFTDDQFNSKVDLTNFELQLCLRFLSSFDQHSLIVSLKLR